LMTKETSLLIVPFFWIWALWDKKIRPSAGIITLCGLAYSLGLGWVITHATWSAGNTGIAYVWPSLKAYWGMYQRLGLLQLGIIAGLISIFIKQRKTAWLFLCLSIVVLAGLLPWKYPLLRLLMTQKIGLAIFLGIVFTDLVKLWRWVILVPIAIIIIKVTYLNWLEIDGFRQKYMAWEYSNSLFLDKLASLPKKSTVVVNVSQDDVEAHEWIIRMPLYLSIFKNRPDIQIKFIDEVGPGYFAWLASWSQYQYLPEDRFGEPVWTGKSQAQVINSGLKKMILHPGQARTTIPYTWKLWQGVDLPAERLFAGNQSGSQGDFK
jgi:hypothetical protein